MDLWTFRIIPTGCSCCCRRLSSYSGSRLRVEIKFPSPEALREQIGRDVRGRRSVCEGWGWLESLAGAAPWGGYSLRGNSGRIGPLRRLKTTIDLMGYLRCG